MIYQLLSGARRVVALASVGVFAVISLGLGWYVGYEAWLRLLEAESGRADFSVPAFQTFTQGSLNPDVVSLRAETVQLQVSGVEPSAQALFIASTALTAASLLFAVTTVVLLCYRLVRGAPVSVGSTVAVALSGTAAFAAGIVGPVLDGAAAGAACGHTVSGSPALRRCGRGRNHRSERDFPRRRGDGNLYQYGSGVEWRAQGFRNGYCDRRCTGDYHRNAESGKYVGQCDAAVHRGRQGCGG